MRALIFAFSGWAEWKENPAIEVAKELDGKEIAGLSVEVMETPVSVRFVRNEVPKLIAEKEPSIVIGVGINPSRPVVAIERVGINVLSFRKPDVDGYRTDEEPVFEDGPAAYFATIPAKRIVERLRKEIIPATISYYAGTFLCNALLYSIMYSIERSSLNALGGFIHIPPTPDKVLKKELPSMPKEMLRRALEVAIEESALALK